MFISPQQAIDEGWIKGIKNLDTQVQPNAIDFTLDRVFSIGYSKFIISTDKETNKEVKQMRGGAEMQPVADRRTGVEFFHLNPNSVYDLLSNVYVDVPNGVAAMLVTRSTFVRNGLFVVSGLYDSGFHGHLGCVLHNRGDEALIERGTRVGQVIFVKSESVHLYDGSYSHGVNTAAPHQNDGAPSQMEIV